MKKTNAIVVMLLVSITVMAGGCHKYQKTEKTVGPAKLTVTHDDKDVKEIKVEMKAEKTPVDNTKSDQQIEKKATDFVAALKLGDAEKDARVKTVITTHMKAVRNWHNEHPYTTVPAGINPVTGLPLSKLHREMIADSAMPKDVHEALMNGLKNDLTPEQVEFILDKYTVGKVAFTMKGYYAIVPDLTKEEAAVLLANLKEARGMAVDFKTMEEISGIFEIYKTKCEQHLISNGRNWRALHSGFVKTQQAAKAAKNAKPADSNSVAK
jgi:hypothetical protein